MKLIYRGAEAELWQEKYLDMPVVRKKRIEKPYKQPLLDQRLRTSRTRNEAKLLSTARKAVNTPHVYDIEETELLIEYIEGTRVKELFYQGKTEIAEKIGKEIRKLHELGLVHNDLTTSNMILSGKKLFFIDFGLGKKSEELEDRATDLVVFKKMLSSTHYDVFEKVWPRFLSGYKANNKILAKINDIEKRARYL
ncbi:Kae1-associated serine/threonine protein kinase [archaeon]|nr:Kae1-associated serine/threonine protein kinase [archaeon]